MKTVSRRLDLILLITVAGAFTVIASQRLGTVPVPDLADEPFMLQTPYELLYEGKFAQGMYRFLGGNIENAWRSLEPGCLLTLSGFFKIFGFGLLQARAFNLAAAAGILVVVFFIARRLVDGRAGLAAVILLATDLTFLERSRMVRTDYAPALFAFLAFYLYEVAESRKNWRFYVASGLSAGIGVLGHPNVLYVVAAILLLMLLRRGFRVLKSKDLVLFATALCAVLAYTVISCLANYQDLRLQYRDDEVHFWIFSGRIWWQNILAEPDRYKAWYDGAGLTFPNLPLTVPHLFQALAAIALIYLVVRVLAGSRRIDDARVRILAPTLVAILFFALVSRKTIYYLVHVQPWLALCAGILLVDAFEALRRWCLQNARSARVLYRGLLFATGALLLVYGLLVARQTRRYLREVRNPELASFEEFKAVIRSVVPEGVCPVAVKAPVIWLAFPESDRCFATIEKRMLGSVDIDGKDYALVTLEKGPESWTRALIADHHLIARLIDSPYGDLSIYYTGINPDILKLEPVRYRFIGRMRGHTSY
jgi:4-amino-4-deoxy-L-arabinose transferase-like glycosyltransferase